MNSGSTGVNKAAMARGAPKGCKKLEDANIETRADLMASTKNKKIVGKPVGPRKRPYTYDSRGTTVASSSFTPARGGRSINQTAHNNADAIDFAPNALAQGSGGQSKVNCPGTRHSHARPRAQKAGHAEARMIDNVFTGRQPRGSMTINVDWVPKTDLPSKMPCEDCHKMMCAAQKCNVEIYLCDKNGKKQKLQEGKHCPATPASYEALQKTMGEAK
jgi:hypothetical protein